MSTPTIAPPTPSAPTLDPRGEARFRALQRTLDGLLEKLLSEPDAEGVKEAARELGIYADGAINIGEDLETEALLDYYLCDASYQGSTRIAQFLAGPPGDLPGAPSPEERALIGDLAASHYAVFEHKHSDEDGTVVYHDMLGDASFTDPYGMLDTQPGDAFAMRLVRSGDRWCRTHEPLRLAPRVKRFFTIPRAVRDLAATLADAEELDTSEFTPRIVLRAVLAAQAVREYMDQTGKRVAPKRPPRSLKRPEKRRRK